MRNRASKGVLTTGQVARICHVSPRTVSKWFDQGQLQGYTVPGSRDRRIPIDQLITFMQAHDIPLDALEGGLCRILVLGNALPEHVAQEMDTSAQYKIQTASTDFQAGVQFGHLKPHVVLVTGCDDVPRARLICGEIRQQANGQTIGLIAIAESLSPEACQQLAQCGYDQVLSGPLNVGRLAKAIDEATNLFT